MSDVSALVDPDPSAPEPTPGSDSAAATPEKLDRALLMTAMVVVLGAIMSILDVTVVNVALPKLVQEFNSTLPTMQWIATGYTLALAAVIPLTGWGADRFGTKRIYLISLFLFTAGSVLAATATSANTLIAYRVLQGLGGGMLMPAGMTILTKAAGPGRIGRVMAVIGVPMLLGPIVGPILGGYLIDNASWHWIFLINLPIGITAMIAASLILVKDVPSPSERLDLPGLLLLSPSLALMIFGLAKSAEQGTFTEPIVWGPVVAGAVLLGLFVARSLTAAQPLVDLRLYKNKVFSLSSATLFLIAVSVFGGMLLIPIYLMQVRGQGALDTGLLMAPQGIGAMIAMPIAGLLADRTGVGKIVPVGLVVIVGSFIGLTSLAADTSFTTLGVYLFIMGLGMGFAMMPTFSGAMQTLRSEQVARASTSLNIIQQVGASVGTALMTVLFTSILSDRLTPQQKDFADQMAQMDPSQAPPADASPEMLAQLKAMADSIMAATSEAFGSTYLWAAGFVAVAVVVALFLPKQKAAPVEGSEAHIMVG